MAASHRDLGLCSRTASTLRSFAWLGLVNALVLSVGAMASGQGQVFEGDGFEVTIGGAKPFEAKPSAVRDREEHDSRYVGVWKINGGKGSPAFRGVTQIHLHPNGQVDPGQWPEGFQNFQAAQQCTYKNHPIRWNSNGGTLNIIWMDVESEDRTDKTESRGRLTQTWTFSEQLTRPAASLAMAVDLQGIRRSSTDREYKVLIGDQWTAYSMEDEESYSDDEADLRIFRPFVLTREESPNSRQPTPEEENADEAETEEQLGGLVETKDGNISLKDFHEQYGGVHLSEEEVLEWLASERETWGPGQLPFHGPDGLYDFKTRNPFNTYEIDGRIYNAAQFGNWLAGYNGGYWLGHLGRGLMIVGGVVFDATDTLKDRLGFDAGNPPYLPAPEFDWDRDSRNEILSGWRRGMADNPHRRALIVAPLSNNDASPTQVTRPSPPQGPAVPGSTPTPFVPEPASVQGARLQQLFEEQVFTFPDTIFSDLHDGTQQAEIPTTHFDGLHRQPIDLLLQQLEVPSTQPPKIESLDLNAILQTSAFPTLQSPGWESLELVIEEQSNLPRPVQTELGRLLDRQDLESLWRNALEPNEQGLTPRPEIPAVKPAKLQLQPGNPFQPRLPTIQPPGPFQP